MTDQPAPAADVAASPEPESLWVARGLCGCIDLIVHEGGSDELAARVRAQGLRLEKVPKDEAVIGACPHRIGADAIT